MKQKNHSSLSDDDDADTDPDDDDASESWISAALQDDALTAIAFRFVRLFFSFSFLTFWSCGTGNFIGTDGNSWYIRFVCEDDTGSGDDKEEEDAAALLLLSSVRKSSSSCSNSFTQVHKSEESYNELTVQGVSDDTYLF